MSPILIKALQLLLCLSLLILLHELGHFGFARLFKVKVDKFFLFFDYKFHLFSTRDKWFTRLFPHFRNNETEFGIGWIPLGGYAKISGMVDESLDAKQLSQPAKPGEFRGQTVWKRFFIIVGGVLMNLLTAFVIYCGIMYYAGEDRLPMTNITEGFAFNAEAKALGLQDGDIPVRIDGRDIKGYTPGLVQQLAGARLLTVLRDGREVTKLLPEKGLDMLDLIYMQPPFMVPISPARVETVLDGGPAARAGVKAGARLLSVDETPVDYWSDYDSLFLRRQDVVSMKNCTHADSMKMRVMSLVFQNPGAARPDTATLELTEDYMMGVVRYNQLADYEVQHIDYDFLGCIPAGCAYGWETLCNYVFGLRYLATPRGAREVGSFLSIGSLFPDTWDWLRFWTITALISLVLAVMNILPIPGLDGGHAVILLYEAITGRQPSERVQLWLEYIGMALLLALMVLAFSNDIRKFFF